MKILKTFISILSIAFLLWCSISYIDILINNTNLDGTPSEFAKWNLFTILM